MLIFDFLEKGLGLISPPQFVHDFSRKIFLIFYFINRPSLIASLLFFLEILGHMCIIIICFPVYDVIIFEFSLSVLGKPFSAWPKTSGQKFEYLKNENTTLKVSVFSPNVGKYGPEKLRIQTPFTQ